MAVARAVRPRAAPERGQPRASTSRRRRSRCARSGDAVRRRCGALAAQGLGILYVTHHLEEVLELADRVTVLRDGVRVALERAVDLSEARLAGLIVGAEPARARARQSRAGARAAAVLAVGELGTATLEGISFTVGGGEIVGAAGIDGSGREELAQALFGGIERHGDVRIDGRTLPALRPDLAVRCGVGLVPADRAHDAVLTRMSVAENLTAPALASRLRGLLLDRSHEQQDARAWSTRLELLPANPQIPIDDLSGGNQQKVVVGRCLRVAPRLLILDEPTKGVDVAAVSTIWALIADAAADGAAVLACSSDAAELAEHCDRVLVLRRGRVVAQLDGEDLRAAHLDALTLTDAAEGPACAR